MAAAMLIVCCHAGAKDKMGLRVHGLIVGSPEKKRADPAVLRQLCASILPNGKNEVPSLLSICWVTFAFAGVLHTGSTCVAASSQ